MRERTERTVFVGNIQLEVNPKALWKYFKSCGKIEKIWFRSIPINELSAPRKAAVSSKNYGTQKTSKNAYVLFVEPASLDEALKLNGTLWKGRTLRVDRDGKKSRDSDDNETTIFVGNVPLIVDEEELRQFFGECGEIEYIRVIRDQRTLIGKGICYVKYVKKEDMRKSIQMLNGEKFKGRELRIKKSVSVKRMEKKKKKTAEFVKQKLSK